MRSGGERLEQDEITRAIGVKVRAARSAAGISRKVLASTADVSERYLHQLENGTANASVGILARVARALDLDLVSLITDARLHGPPNDAAHGALAGPLARLLSGTSHDEQLAALPMVERFLDARRRSRRGIALLGMRGAGKSTLGRSIAERHGLPFVSVTQEIEARAGMNVNDLFNLGGAEAYRSLENEVISALAEREEQIVLETAGGIAGNATALALVLGAFRSVWIKASPQEHLSRVAGQGDTRPMRGNPKALEHLKAMLAQREAGYARAEMTLETGGKSVEQSLSELERLLAPALRGSVT